MLDEKLAADEKGWVENEDCGCVIAKTTEVDGEQQEVHHWIPDDTAEHVPDPECGCKPVLREEAEGVILFEHWDQDDPQTWKTDES